MNELNTFVDHLAPELQQLYELFDKRWPDYKDSWKERTFHWLMQRFLGEVDELHAAIANGEGWERIRDETLDCILTAFFVLNAANTKLEHQGRASLKRHADVMSELAKEARDKSWMGLR